MGGGTVIIGLDGVPFGLLEALAGQGVMPETAGILREGVFTRMRSSIPEVSSVAWSSVITGANPAEHGIFGFTDFVPGTYDLTFPNFAHLKKDPFWAGLPGKSVILNVPSTYPVRPMNGVHVSGFVSISYEKSVYPPSLIPRLHQLDYRLDVDSALAHEDMDRFLEDLDKCLAARIEGYRYLWDEIDWRVFMLVFTGTDRLMHFLWSAYEDPGHRYHGAFLDHFRSIDRAIGEIRGKMGLDDQLIMLSDHGFERLEKDVYINRHLMENGMLKVDARAGDPWAAIDGSSRAFAMDPARLYVNRKEKYPRGQVREKEREKVIEELIELFRSFTCEGRQVIRDIHRAGDIYRGPLLDRGPDLVLVAETGFNLRAGMKAPDVFGRGIFTGKHTLDDAFLYTIEGVDRGGLGDPPDVEQVAGLIGRK